jgi:membrane protein YqaA with SNARE-associated domain
MQNKTGLAKVCDNFAKKRQLCDNFATTEKRKNSNEIIRYIYIYLGKLSLLFSWLVPISVFPLLWGSGR